MKANDTVDLYSLLTINFSLGVEVLLVVASAVSFITISYATVAKFRQCQKGMADWSEVIVLGAGAALLLVFTAYLYTGAGELVG